MINKDQLVELVIKPSILSIDKNALSDSAINLILGTCAQESRFGTYIAQIKGPALGIYQMEPNTYYDIIDNYLNHREFTKRRIFSFCGYETEPSHHMLICNLRLSTIFCRIHYLRVPEKIPDANDIEGLASYWKRYYNTYKGRGTEEEFIDNFKRYVF